MISDQEYFKAFEKTAHDYQCKDFDALKNIVTKQTDNSVMLQKLAKWEEYLKLDRNRLWEIFRG